MIREIAALALVAGLAFLFPPGAAAKDDPLGDLLEQFAKQLELNTFCAEHHGHARCKKLEELRAFCAANSNDTTRCHTSAAQALLYCDSQSSEERVHCVALLHIELEQGAAPQFGPPITFGSSPEPPEPALRCVPVAVFWQAEQIRILFVREAYQHPEMLHLPVRKLLFYALAKAFPCPARQSPPATTAKQDPTQKLNVSGLTPLNAQAPDDWFVPGTDKTPAQALPDKRTAPKPNPFDQFDQVEVALNKEGGVFVVPVQINGAITLNFAIDSGATDVSVPLDVFSTLRRTGTVKDTDIVGEQTYVLADGTKSRSVTFTIRSLKVGYIIVENVEGGVAPAQGSLLLGQSFLERFKSWSIDNATHELLLERR